MGWNGNEWNGNIMESIVFAHTVYTTTGAGFHCIIESIHIQKLACKLYVWSRLYKISFYTNFSYFMLYKRTALLLQCIGYLGNVLAA